jgi:hypothetical protein
VIFDCFMFRGDGPEMDLLEFRLEHMRDYDVTHVLTESGFTHRGIGKRLWYRECRDRFAAFGDRIVRVEASLPSNFEAPQMDPWAREHMQRDAAGLALGRMARRSDLVLIADLDEFPDMDVLAGEADRRERSGVIGPAGLQQRVFAFAVDWEFPWLETTSAVCGAVYARQASLSAIRDSRQAYPVRSGAGWHFSWLGGKAGIKAKARAHCHAELDDQLVQGADSGVLYEQGAGVWGCNLMPAEVDKTWPRYVYERRCPESWFRPGKGALA